MDRTLIQFEHVSKRYYLGTRKAFLRELLPQFVSKRSARSDELWALKDVSFEVKSGEALGIIGANGSGKTTTLSLLAGITGATSGQMACHGSVGALIQLGAGFHPELTGRENVYLNASILGLKRKEVDRIYDAIVDFSELQQFMDTPVKRYSSGMYARLGFSVAAHIDPDILLVDEVLAVGDMAFQAKCIARMHQFVDRGKAIIFVSHNLNMVQSLCSRVLWLDHGLPAQLGDSVEVIGKYYEEMDRRLAATSFDKIKEDDTGTGDIRIERVVLRDGNGEIKSDFRSRDALTVELHYDAARRITRPYFWIGVGGKSGTLFGANMLLDGVRPDYVEGQGILSCTFQSLPLLPQNYHISAGIRSEDGALNLVRPRQFGLFRVVGKLEDMGLAGTLAESLARDSAPLLMPYEWLLPDGTIHRVNSKERMVFET